MARKRKKDDAADPAKKTHYTIALTPEQMDKLERYGDAHSFAFYDVDHARFAYKGTVEKVNVVAYKSGKVVIQGKGTEEFVQNVIEAEITGDPQLGYEEVHHPEWFEPHAGLDEAGKGDLFGPVVTACVIADGDMVREWMKQGIRDSKTMTDGAMIQADKLIRKTKGVAVETAYCGMARYNELMAKPTANLNKLLAWLHAKSLEAALKQRRVEWGMLDQFSKKPLVQDYFKDKTFDLRMQTKAEADPVVAAASICARVEFIRYLKKLSDAAGEPLLKGAGAKVKKQATAIVQRMGPEALGDFAKLHFRTAFEAKGLEPPPKKVWVRR